MNIVEELAERIGPRPAGSAAETRAGRYVGRLAEEAGASLSAHPFVFRGWRSGGQASMRLRHEGIEFQGDPLPYTVGTPPGGAEGTLRDMGEWPLVPGRIHCRRFVLEDRSERPVAAVMACPYEDVRALPNPQPLASMPTLVVGLHDGHRLAKLVADGRSGVDARVEIASQWEGLLSGENVVADLGPGAHRLLVVAHVDTVPESPGANDNAAGVAVAMRLLTRLADTPPSFGTRFVFTAAEEPFLVGSRAYAGELAATGEIATIAGCLNLDMVAVGDHYVVRTPWDEGWQRAVGAVAANPPGPTPVMTETSTAVSDHWSFHEVGIPSVQLTRTIDSAWHGALDLHSRVSEAALEEATDMAERLVHSYMSQGGDER